MEEPDQTRNWRRMGSEQTAVVAMGIDSEGRKHILDFSLGSSESLEVSRELVSRIITRGFGCEHRLYVVLDGSDALRGAVKEVFPDCVVQRCLVHKERNIKSKLSKRHWGELSRLFARLRSVQGIDAAEEVFAELRSFLEPINAEAYRSLHEAGEDLLALHRLTSSTSSLLPSLDFTRTRGRTTSSRSPSYRTRPGLLPAR